MKKIEDLDLEIIEQFEKVTHFIQKYTGIDNFDLVYIVAILLSVSPFYFIGFVDGIVTFILFWFFSYLLVFSDIGEIKERVYRDLESGHKNYLVIERINVRLFSSILQLIFLVINDPHVSNFNLFLSIDLYLISCTPISGGIFNKDFVPDTV